MKFNSVLKHVSLGLVLIPTQVLALEFPLVQVEKEGHSTLLLGSSHVGTANPLRRKDIDQIVKGRKSVCFETDPTDVATVQKVSKVVFANPTGSNLRDRLGGELYAKVEKQLSWASKSGIPIGPMSPYTAGTLLTMSMPRLRATLSALKPEESLDAEILSVARNSGLIVNGIENSDALVNSFSTISNDEWKQYISGLISILDCPSCASAFEENMIKAFSPNSNPEAAFSYANIAFSQNRNAAAIYNKFFYSSRNANLAQNISLALDRKSCDIVAIGAGHLGGHSGVLVQLKKRGATIKIINRTGEVSVP